MGRKKMKLKVGASGDIINLRAEMDAILNGGLGVGPSGYWVIYRHYKRSEKSPYYSNFTDEGVGGPPYEYDEYIVKTYRMPAGKRVTSSDDSAPIGTVPTHDFIYYFKASDLPIEILPEYDTIYEIEGPEVKPDKLSNVKRLERYKVRGYQRYRQAGGRIEYYAIYVTIDIISEEDKRL